MTLTEKIACAAAAACSPPRPLPAPRTAAESRRLYAEAHAHAAAARGVGRDGRGWHHGGDARLPWKARRRRGRQVVVPPQAQQPDWWILPRSQPRGSNQAAGAAPTPLVRAPGGTLAPRGGGWRGDPALSVGCKAAAPWLRAAVFTLQREV